MLFLLIPKLPNLFISSAPWSWAPSFLSYALGSSRIHLEKLRSCLMGSPAQCPVRFCRSCGEREAWIKPGLCLTGFGNSLLFIPDLLREEIGVLFACSNEKKRKPALPKNPPGPGAWDKPVGQLTLRKKAGVQE